MGIIDIINNQGFIQFISTFGLAVFLVLYLILIRDPKTWKQLDNNYKNLNDRFKEVSREYEAYKTLSEKYMELSDSYKILQETYSLLNESIRPETVKMTVLQAKKLNDTAIDRDLFKLFFRLCEKIDGDPLDVSSYIKETIFDTNETWAEFCPPFRNPEIRSLTDLYDMYKNGGTELKSQLEEILNSDESIEGKKGKILNILKNNAVNMKREFRDILGREGKEKPVLPHEQVDNKQEKISINRS